MNRLIGLVLVATGALLIFLGLTGRIAAVTAAITAPNTLKPKAVS